ncbi:uncharacterized protein C17orf78 homolog [Terrapene carolina triunguis]|uniref:uncharacterized protein C17orf78 homolog n=1 Tax=Terrapene triunguis TaxID=2587831 RepID=UPI001156310F|nr:uncharacterized protein C17orf78 homolog [Terrapene carolina triunguis]
MDTILVFSLLFIYYSLSPKDLRDYDCRVENSSEVLSESTRSMSILLQESEKTVAKGELRRNHTVATLQCSGLHSSIQVNLLYSEKMYGVFTNKPNVKYTLQSLKVITDPDESVSTAHSCLLLTDHKQSFQTEFNLTGKVFLVGISNCIINAKLSEPEIFAEQVHSTAIHQQNSSSGIGEGMLLRLTQRQSIYVKAVIICVLLPCALAFIVFVIFEVPFPSVHALVGASKATVFRNVKDKEKNAQKTQILYHRKNLSRSSTSLENSTDPCSIQDLQANCNKVTLKFQKCSPGYGFKVQKL